MSEIENLTNAERALFDMLKAANGAPVELDTLMQGAPEKDRHGFIVRLKYLAAKTAPTGYVIERHSAIGRSRKASYIMNKRFTPGKTSERI